MHTPSTNRWRGLAQGAGLIVAMTLTIAPMNALAGASGNDDMADIRALYQSMRSRMEHSGAELLKGLDRSTFQKKVKEYRPEARRIVDEMKGRLAKGSKAEGLPDQHSDAEVEYLYFASWSLGPDGLKQMFRDAAAHGDRARVVLRGIRKGGKLPAGLERYYDIAKQLETPPRLILDPTLFDRYVIDTVPTVIRVSGEGALGKRDVVARVSGLHTSRWLAEQVDEGSKGDLGIRGPVSEISEPDLIEVMKKRLAAVDWTSKREKAVRDFWKEQKFQPLPKATEDRVRMIDPTVVVTSDIKDTDGKVLVPRGTRINPLRLRSFNRVLYIFDATDEQQVNWVNDRLAHRGLGDPLPVLMASRLTRADGWKNYEKLTQKLDEPVYKLMPDVRQRWELQRVPSVVTADGDRFKVKEIALGQGADS